MSYYPEGSMAGSGIDSIEVPYDEFVCEADDCGKVNEASEAMTDDYGNYEVECQFCGSFYFRSSIAEDKADWAANNYDY